MKTNRFSAYDMILIIISLLSYILDTISDVFIIIVFYLEGHYIWGSLSLAFISLSSVSMLLFSFRWHVTDRTLTCKTFLPHLVFLAPLHRYIEVLRLGYKSRQTRKKDDLDDALRANVDVSMLRLIEAFTESAPQLVLQLYIMLKFSHYNWLIGVSTVLSLTSVAFSLTAYNDALRMAYKENYNRSWLGISTLTFWQSWMLLSRVTAMVVFSLVFQAWIFLAMGLHWILMTFWITMQNAGFGETACEKRLFNSVSGFIYIFCFLNLKEGHSRNRMTAFYCFILAENSLLILLWFIYHPEDTATWLKVASLSIVFGGFVLGGILMVSYYCCCHPTSKTTQDKKDITAYWFRRAKSIPKRDRDSIFDDGTSAGRVADWLNASVSLSNNDLDSKCLSMDDTFNLSLPDILKNGSFFNRTNISDSRSLNNSKKSSGHRSNRSHKNRDWNDTVNSAKSSCLSASSSRPLINDSPSLVSYISNSRDTFSFSNNVILDQDRCASVNSIPSSERAFALTGQNMTPKVSKSDIEDDSFYASPEYKTTDLSPLDAKKLWDESQSRFNNTASQIIEIITTTNLKRRTSESRITWKKIDNKNVDGNEKYCTDYKHNSSDNPTYIDDFYQHPYVSSVQPALIHTSEENGLNVSEDEILESSNKENVIPPEESSQMTSYAPQASRDYTSEYESRSELSNFFGDISSFHVTSPEVGEYYMSSVSGSKLNEVEEESDEYNNSLRCWSHRMLSRINKELQNGSSSDTTPSLTSSYIQEENSCSNNEIGYQTSMSNYDSTEQSRSSYSSQQTSKSPPDSSSSFATESSYSRHSTSDTGVTSASDNSNNNCYKRYSSTTDKSTDDSGYSVAKSQSLKCLNSEKIQNSLTFVTKLDSDSDLGMRIGSDNDFLRTIDRTNSQRCYEGIGFEHAKGITGKIKTAQSLPGLSYLCGSDTTTWLTDESSVNVTLPSDKNTSLNHNTSILKDEVTIIKDKESSRSVRFEDQTPVKSSLREPSKMGNITPVRSLLSEPSLMCNTLPNRSSLPKPSLMCNITPVKVGKLNQSPFRPGKIIREDLTPVKLEKFSHSPLRPGTSVRQNSSLDVTDYDDSPHRLGRSIDLFDRVRYRNNITDVEMDSNTPIRELKESPYKFRFVERKDKENKYTHEVQRANNRRHSSILPQQKKAENITGKVISRSSSKLREINQTYDLENSEPFTNIKPRTIVDDFKKKHVARNCQKKVPAYRNDLSLYQSESMTNPCYSYSDTESEADISGRSHIGPNKYDRVQHHPKSFRTPISAGEGKREVLKRLDNTPGFSPILTPDDVEAIQSCNTSSDIVKPIVSTPKINPEVYTVGFRYIDDSPSTIEV